MTPDPHIQHPNNLQDYNRYSYCLNSPVGCTDPSGYFSLGKAFRVAAIVVISYYTGGAAAGWYASAAGVAATSTTALIVGGAAGGFTAGFLSSGGDFNAGLQGAFTGAVFAGIGAAANANGWGMAEKVGAHAVGGCITASAGGGSCAQGAISAAVGKAATGFLTDAGSWGDNNLNDFTRGVAVSMAGGLVSKLAGGKFDNGATTAAFGYLFNHLSGLGKVQKGVRGFASMVSDMASGDFQLAEPEVWGRTGSGERFRADGVFANSGDGRTMLGGAVVVCESKCGPTADLSARQIRVYDAISRNDFYLEGPRAASVAAQTGLNIDSAGRLYIPAERFGGTYLGVYEGSAAHLKPSGQKVNWGAIFGGVLRGNE